MVRVGLTIYLAFATLAGPLVCCCSTSRLLGGLFPVPCQPPNAEHSQRPTCCQQARAPRPGDGPVTSGDGQTPSGKPSKSPFKPCPCRERVPDARPAPLAEPSDHSSNVVRLLLGDWAASACLSLDTLAAATLPADALKLPQSGPFVTTEELLRAHHLLRC